MYKRVRKGGFSFEGVMALLTVSLTPHGSRRLRRNGFSKRVRSLPGASSAWLALVRSWKLEPTDVGSVTLRKLPEEKPLGQLGWDGTIYGLLPDANLPQSEAPVLFAPSA